MTRFDIEELFGKAMGEFASGIGILEPDKQDAAIRVFRRVAWRALRELLYGTDGTLLPPLFR